MFKREDIPYRPIAARLDRLYIRQPRWYLVAVLAGYLVAAMLFALRTPAWQNPDEPAHYNNIAFIAQEHRLPVLRMGDYNQAYQDALLAAGFPPDQSIAPCAMRHTSRPSIIWRQRRCMW